ncbi:MAG: hypothetical protein AABX28_03385 [Nanoarchaeota archaeon]
MRAILFGNTDYLLQVYEGEFELLPRQCLETQLQLAFRDDDLGKKVVLRYKDNPQSDGIDLRYLPENAQSSDEIQEIEIDISSRAYNLIRERGKFGTRYNGSDKIDIEIVEVLK